MRLPRTLTYRGSMIVYLVLKVLSSVITSITPGDHIIIPTIHGFKLVLPKRGYASGARPLTLMFGVVEPQWRGYFKTLISKAKVFVDVGGASDIYYTLLATRLNKDVIVLVLEPSPTEYKYSVHNVKINKVMNRVLCFNMGLSDHIEETIIEGKRVKFVRLDDLGSKLNLESVDIIKVDVEGAGALVIKGAEKTIEKHKPIIFFEVHNKSEEDTIKELARRGYKVIREPGDMYVLVPVNTHR
jgi:hypothetical protein